MNNLETEFKFKIDKLPVVNFDKAKKHYIKQIYFNGRNKTSILKNYFPDVDFDLIVKTILLQSTLSIYLIR